MALKDERTKMVNEVLNGIKVRALEETVPLRDALYASLCGVPLEI